jgi:hypothetical protein
MKKIAAILAVFALAALPALVSAAENSVALGFSRNTTIISAPTPDSECALAQQDDGTFENGYAWAYAGVAEPDYGSWAECYDNAFVCTVNLFLTDVGYYMGQSCDVYVWEDAGGNPGNVLFVLNGFVPGQPAFWPDISEHVADVNFCANGPHFVGFWPNWPGQLLGWFIASDENGLGMGCPRTKIAPGIGYPTGWQHPNVVSTFGACLDLGIRETYLTSCEPTATEETTWGKIKALY